MRRQHLLAALAATSIGLALSQGVTGRVGDLLFLGTAGALPALLMSLGALPDRAPRRAWLPFAGILVLLELPLLLIWWSSGSPPPGFGPAGSGPWGLPWAAVFLLGGLWLLPLLVVPTLYAWSNRPGDLEPEPDRLDGNEEVSEETGP